MKASDAFALMLAKHDISFCFELIGGMLTHLIDSLAEQGDVRVVSMHHEQAAAFAAEGVVRQAGNHRLAVAMGTSGPGATNLITGISSCWLDSVPCLFITGQVNRAELRGDRNVRQQGFQELDVVELARSVTKYAVRVDDELQLLPMLHRAMSEALSGRQAPVLLDIPNDIQRLDIPDDHVEQWLNRPLMLGESPPVPDELLNELVNLCAESHRPLLCLGGGVNTTDLFPDWLAELNQCGIPHISTLMGQKSIPDSSSYFHMLGTYGNREANWAVQNCDLLIVLGARLDVRQTGADSGDFARHAKIVQVDVDQNQLNNRVSADLSIHCTVGQFIDQFKIEAMTFPSMDQDWLNGLRERERCSDRDEYLDLSISPYKLFDALNQTMSGSRCHYVCDIGNHQMWAAQLLRLSEGQSIHHDGGLGAMGFALPAAIGVALESQDKTIVISGDGGMQINIQELDTIWRMKLDLTVIVLNNYSLGMVKNFQDMYFDGRNHSTLYGYSCPSFADVAEAYQIKSIQVENYRQWEHALKQMRGTQSPLLIEVLMKDATECRPRLAYGGKLDQQHPVND